MSDPTRDSPSTEPTLRLATQLVEEGREADAVALLELHPVPMSKELHRAIATRAATAALQERDIAAAIAWLDRGLAPNPTDPTLNFFRGNLFFDAGHFAEAAACFRRSVTAEPRREEYICGLGQALIAAGRAEDAVPVLAELAESAIAQLALGVAYQTIGDMERAAGAYERAGQLRPDCFEVWFDLGLTRQKLGHWPASLSAFNRAVALRPTSADAHLARGNTLAQLGQPEAAAAAFTHVLRLDTGHTAARQALGRLPRAPQPLPR